MGGSKNLLATFDLSRPGNEPLRLRQISKASKRSQGGGGIGMSGIISSLTIDPASNILAAATFSREVGLFDVAGQGESLGVFHVKGNEADNQIGGGGVTQLAWSVCGRYLYIGERRSDGIMVYDIRKTGQLLSWAIGRNAYTNQRLSFDIAPSTTENAKQEIWAGGVDGKVQVWTDIHLQEGSCQPAYDWQAHAGDFFSILTSLNILTCLQMRFPARYCTILALSLRAALDNVTSIVTFLSLMLKARLEEWKHRKPVQ